MSSRKFLQPPTTHHHKHHTSSDDEEEDETRSLLWSAASSIHHDHYYETSSTSDMDAASTMSYATFHTVKEPEQHLIERGLLFPENEDEGLAFSSTDHHHHKSTSCSSTQESDYKQIHMGMLIFCLCISIGSLGLDTGIVLFLLNIISTEFQSSHLGIWIHLSYLLGCLMAQSLCRNLTRLIGRKPLLVIAQCLFLVGSLSCSATQDMMQIMISRMVAGLGGGMLIPLSSMVILDRVIQRHYDPSFSIVYYERYHLFIRTAPVLGVILGPYIAGVIHTWIGWRYCFYINLTPCMMTLCLYMFWLPNYDSNHKKNLSTQPRQRNGGDYLGILLLVLAITSLVTGIALGGNVLAWYHPIIIALLSTGGLLACLFLVNEFLWTSNPILPGHLLLQQFPTILVQFTTWSSFIMMLYLLPTFFMGVRQQNAPLAGLWLIPNSASFMIATLISGWYHTMSWCSCITRGKNKSIIATQWILILLSLFHIGMTLSISVWWHQDTLPILFVLTQVIYGYVTGTLIVGSLSFYHFFTLDNGDHVSQPDQDTLISIPSIIRTLGELIGLASVSAILQANLKSILIEKISEPTTIEHIRTLISNIHTLSPSLQSIVQEALLLSIQRCFLYYGTICAILGFLATIFISTMKKNT
ncbi:major facilitator superfamily domain-containing protein [Phascolomyces articulosus]|uniref:Major facilitator superfamily domain-containing protein n=1 Tax=Phascolomyces articulosus TaxID=60185 RepID=A0AAD5K3Z1_9FUNG|nr:major facilitator superfamily domain-containing protein [Phascolomyces articulosus]